MMEAKEHAGTDCAGCGRTLPGDADSLFCDGCMMLMHADVDHAVRVANGEPTRRCTWPN